jgi:integrase
LDTNRNFSNSLLLDLTRVEIQKIDNPFLSQKEIQYYMTRLEGNSKHRLIFRFIVATGIRQEDLVRLRISNLNFEEKSLTIPPGFSGKLSRQRTIGLERKLYLDLIAHINSIDRSAPLFPGQSGRMSVQSIRYIFSKISKDSEYPPLTLHRIRDALRRYFMDQHLSSEFIQYYLGNISSRSVRRKIQTVYPEKISNQNIFEEILRKYA